MIDRNLILEQPERVFENARKRGKKIDANQIQALLKERLEALAQTQSLQEEANLLAQQIPKADESERGALKERGKALKGKVKEAEAGLSAIEAALEPLLRQIPNMMQEDVPEGPDASANKEIRTSGTPTAFAFEPKNHVDIAEGLGLLDLERAANVSGSRFAYLKGDLVLLEYALTQFALETLVQKGFTPVLPPHIISTDAMGAMGYLDHGGEEEVYHLKNDEAVLIGTSEQSIGPMHMDELLDADQLPLRYVGISPCYRREAGSYGKDVRGMIRMHQFDKVEMFSFTHPDKSVEEHELLLSLQEELMQALKLPYRVMLLSTGDTGAPSAKTYDIETWIPSEKTYRETHSTSNTTDYQTRRLNIRFKEGKKKGLVHALNGTAFAMSRVPVAILENYQQADGSVLIPDVLQRWMGKKTITHS